MCSTALEHSYSPGGPKATLMTLVIDPGYWRASNVSRYISVCYNKDACNGGLTGSTDYCSEGYEGACEFDYIPYVSGACIYVSVRSNSLRFPTIQTRHFLEG